MPARPLLCSPHQNRRPLSLWRSPPKLVAFSQPVQEERQVRKRALPPEARTPTVSTATADNGNDDENEKMDDTGRGDGVGGAGRVRCAGQASGERSTEAM